jgi:hypothetical protein
MKGTELGSPPNNKRGRLLNMYKLVCKSILGLLMAGVIPVVGTPTAMAVLIDFTDRSWDGAQGQVSFTTHPSNVDLRALGGALTVNYNGGPSGDNSDFDGLGIGDDEIGGVPEGLRISFEGPVTLQSVNITDLFQNEGGLNRDSPEVGWYSINGGYYHSFSAAVGQVHNLTNGELILDINLANVNSIFFRANLDDYSDYSVRGLTYTSVPEPSTLILLGFGFLIAATLYRRGYFPSV